MFLLNLLLQLRSLIHWHLGFRHGEPSLVNIDSQSRARSMRPRRRRYVRSTSRTSVRVEDIPGYKSSLVTWSFVRHEDRVQRWSERRGIGSGAFSDKCAVGADRFAAECTIEFSADVSRETHRENGGAGGRDSTGFDLTAENHGNRRVVKITRRTHETATTISREEEVKDIARRAMDMSPRAP